ncbi:MAG: sn-glycerol-3-phosphate ABC transporter ATP-binding protein UgpC, partial [Clostridia bacterium]
MASLSLKHIYKVYPNGVKAVNDFNMEIQDKEFIVFVGPSGCGKSTTLRMIAGLEEITAGELRIGDLVVNDVEPKDRDIAMVFQNYALYPHMTVYDNMAFGLKIRKLPREEIDKKVREAAEVLGITEYLDRKPKEMSGGQRQRVALGRAIVREPKVFLLDEPLSNLDAKLRAQMRTEISKLHTKLNTTFIYVTHDQVEAMTMGTRIVVMKDGFIQQIDTPRDLYLYPNNKFVAGFIGTPQMNFLKGTLKRKGEKVEITIKGTEDVLTVAFEHFVKVRPDYLTGEREVVIGVRPDHLSKEEEFIKQNKTSKIKCKVTAIEELGTESQIYGELDLNDDIKLSESETSIVIKSAPGLTLQIGDVIDVAFNLHHIHLFDAETEESILPRIPEYNFIEGKIVGGKLEVCGAQRILPPA